MSLLASVEKRNRRGVRRSILRTQPMGSNDRLPSGFPSPATRNLANGKVKADPPLSSRSRTQRKIRVGESATEAMKNEAEALSYPMSLWNLADSIANSECVMVLHSNAADELESKGTGKSDNSLLRSMKSLNIDPSRKEKELKQVLQQKIQSSVGSLGTNIHTWKEAKAKLSSVIDFPIDSIEPSVAEHHGNVAKRWDRMTLQSPGSSKKRKTAAKGPRTSSKLGGSFAKYAALLKVKEAQYSTKFKNFSSSFRIFRHMEVPKKIDDQKSYTHETNDEVSIVHDERDIVESVSARMDRLLVKRTMEEERRVREREIKEEERIQREIEEKEEREKREQEEREAEAQRAAQSLLRDLTEEENELIHDAMYGSGPGMEKLALSDTDSVQRSSMQTLRTGTWLNDEVIHYFFLMLSKRDEALCAADSSRKRSHYFKSFFFTKLFDEGGTNEYRYANVKRWSRRVAGKDIFALDKIFFACNVNGMHWTCAVIFMQEKRIQYFDSMRGDGYMYSEGLLRYIMDEWKAKKGGSFPDADKWKIIGNKEDVPTQQNGSDCGVFTCMFADFLSLDRPLSFTQEHIDQCRERIALSILKGVAIE
eukprot:190932_1